MYLFFIRTRTDTCCTVILQPLRVSPASRCSVPHDDDSRLCAFRFFDSCVMRYRTWYYKKKKKQNKNKNNENENEIIIINKKRTSSCRRTYTGQVWILIKSYGGFGRRAVDVRNHIVRRWFMGRFAWFIRVERTSVFTSCEVSRVEWEGIYARREFNISLKVGTFGRGDSSPEECDDARVRRNYKIILIYLIIYYVDYVQAVVKDLTTDAVTIVIEQ